MIETTRKGWLTHEQDVEIGIIDDLHFHLVGEENVKET